jgi:hypothetical protein
LYWEHPGGERCIRIVFDETRVLGFNLMGVRYRHRVCERWIAEQRPLSYVLEHLGEANFDPEFFRQFEEVVVAQWNHTQPDSQVRLAKRRGLLDRISV